MINRPPLPADETLLIAAWHGGDSNRAITVALGINASQLETAWRRLKRDGKLPDGARQRQILARPPENGDHEKKADLATRSIRFLRALVETHGPEPRYDLFPGTSTRFLRKVDPQAIVAAVS